MSVDPERRSAGGRPADERSEAELRMIGCVDRLCLHVCASLLIGILVGLGVWRETGDWRLFAFSTLLFSGVLAFQRVFFPMPWPPPQPPAPPLYADDAVRRRLAGCEVIGLLAEDDEVYLQTGSRKVPLVELMPDTDPLVTARQVQALLRERGAPDGGEVVDADRIRSWLKLRPGERFTCRAGLLEARRIIASDAGLAIRDGRRRWFSGWCDLRDLELALADFECHTWRLVTEQGETRFDPWCRGAATLATAIEYALAEAAVGHPLPAAPDADLPRAPISKAGDDDHAGRGVSRP